eukprot:9492926-Pyramimonas_sp.AAC.2
MLPLAPWMEGHGATCKRARGVLVDKSTIFLRMAEASHHEADAAHCAAQAQGHGGEARGATPLARTRCHQTATDFGPHASV